MRKFLKVAVVFVGWILSPFTWWNDAFINIPLSYLIANGIYNISHLPFMPLVIISYWFTNAIGLAALYYGVKTIILSSQKKLRAAVILSLTLIVYSLFMIYLDKEGKLLPLKAYFEKLLLSTK